MTTDQNILALAEKETDGKANYAYAFGFVWAFLTPEQKTILDDYAAELLAKEKN